MRPVLYWFPPDVKASLARNAEREGRAQVPKVAIFATAKRLVAAGAWARGSRRCTRSGRRRRARSSSAARPELAGARGARAAGSGGALSSSQAATRSLHGGR